MADEETGKMMKVTIKTAKEKKVIEVDVGLIVKDVCILIKYKFSLNI